MKTVFTYLLLVLFAFTFSYKTVRYLIQTKVVDEKAYADVDCENEKEDSVEKDEITDFFYNHFFERKQLLLTEETFLPIELVVNFTATNYSKMIYTPPEFLS